MPGFDGSGPRGMGPRTGGGRGMCPPGSGRLAGAGMRPVRGAGRGGIPWGCGSGRAWGGGRGRWWTGPGSYGSGPGPAYAPSAEDELQVLKNQAAFMEQELDALRRRMEQVQGHGQAEDRT